MRAKTAFAALLGLLAALLVATPVQAHYSMAPKLSVEPATLATPAAAFLRLNGEVTATRGDFARYLQRITAFDTKYVRLLPRFWLHLELLRGIALHHPDNVYSVIDRLPEPGARDGMRTRLLQRWFAAQAEMFAGIAQRAATTELDENEAFVMTLYAASAKAAFLEELVVLGAMTPSVAGLRDHVAALPEAERRRIDTGIDVAGDELTPPEEQAAQRARWQRFRRDVVAQAEIARRCGEIDDPAAAPATVALSVGGQAVSLGELFAVFGVPEDARRWQGVRTGHCARTATLLALGRLADDLGIVPERVTTDIAVTGQLYRAARAVAARYDADDIEALTALSSYPRLLDVRDAFLQRTARTMRQGEADIAAEVITGTPWSLARRMAPLHAVHY